MIAIHFLLQIDCLSQTEGAATMEPLFRANRAILAQKMLTVRFGQYDVVYWLSVLSLFLICADTIVFSSAERDDPAPATDGSDPHPWLLP